MNLTPLRQRDFALLWWAGLISMTGDWTLRIALPIFVLLLTGSPAAVGLVVIAGLAGSLLFGTVAGAYVDRWDRRRVVVAVNGLQALALLPLLAVASPARVWIVVAVGFVEAALAQFFEPAEQALLPRLVGREQLAAANALGGLNNHIARLVGPAIGGLAAAALGLAGAALLDAASFLLAAALCALITGRHRAEHPVGAPRHLGRELLEGLVGIGASRIARAILIFAAVTAVGEGMMGTLFSAFVTRALHGGGREMGLLLSAQAVGGILGSLAGTRVATRWRPVPLMATCYAAFGVIDLAIFNYPRWGTALWPVVVLFGLVGIPAGIAGPVLLTLLQLQTADRLRGRTFAAFGLCQAVAGILGAALAGALGDTVSVVSLLTAQGGGYVLAGALLRVLAGRGPAVVSALPDPLPAPPPARELMVGVQGPPSATIGEDGPR